MRRVLFLAAVCLVAAAVSGPGAARANERLALSYEIWKGGFHALDLDAGLQRDGGSYSISFTARTRGLIGWVFPYFLEGEADGKLGGQGPRPDRFATLARSSGDELRRAISYQGDGTLVTWSDPPRAPGDDDATVPVPLRRDTLDPASAIVAVIEAVARAGRCDGNYPVYDGRRRYDLIVALVGPSPLSSSRYSSYSGPATLCRVAVGKLAGFKGHRGGGGTLPASIDVWLASVARGQPAVPVRLQGDSEKGRLIIHLVGAKLEPVADRSHPRAAAR